MTPVDELIERSRARAVARATVASAWRGILRSMTPAERLGRDLADARRRGEPFAEAWTVAVKHAIAGQRRDERTVWSAAFTETAEAWRAAWERRPATRAQVAVLAIATDPERERAAA